MTLCALQYICVKKEIRLLLLNIFILQLVTIAITGSDLSSLENALSVATASFPQTEILWEYLHRYVVKVCYVLTCIVLSGTHNALQKKCNE